MQEYRPPVKSSVKKLYSDRSSSSSSTSTSSSSSSRRHFRGGSSSSSSLDDPVRKQRRRFSSSSSKAAHAAGVSVPTSSSKNIARGVAQSFERRMRELVLGGQQQRRRTASVGSLATQSPRSAGNNPFVKVIQSLSEYKKVVGDEREKIVVVRFFATYCKACKAVAPHFYKLAAKHGKNDDVIFVDVPVTENNSALHQGLGIPSLPYAHIYHPQAGLVEESPLTRKHVADFAQTLESYMQGSCLIVKN